MTDLEIEKYKNAFCDAMFIHAEEIEEIRYKDNIFVGRFYTKKGTYILKYFDNIEDTREIENYKYLQQNDMETIKIYYYGKNFIIMEDLQNTDIFRLAKPEDLNDKNVIKNLAKWYKKLHKIKPIKSDYSYNEVSLINKQNLQKLKHFLGKNCDTIDLILAKLDKINLCKNEFSYTLNYNDFSVENLVVGNDSAFMFDYNLLGNGYIYADLKNIENALTPQMFKVFLKNYGLKSFNNNEVDYYNITSPIIGLIVAISKEVFPEWANDLITKINTIQYKNLLQNL